MSHHKRHFLRCSVRELLLLLALVGVFLALVAPRFQRAYSQRREAMRRERAVAAGMEGDLLALEQAVADGVDLNDPRVYTPQGVSLLEHAVQKDDLLLARRLLELGADPNAHVRNVHIVFQAIETGSPEMIALLLSQGASAEGTVQGEGPSMPYTPNVRPLQAAIKSKLPPDVKLRIVRTLLKKGAEVQPPTPAASPLDLAVQQSDAKMTDLLIQYGANYTAREAVAFSRLDDAKRMVEENPAILHERFRSPHGFSEGPTLLGLALERGHREIADFLLEAGAPLDGVDSLGRTPLHLAVAGGDAELVRRLLALGHPVDARDSHHDTPLHDAAYQGRAEAVAILIAAGADVNAQGGPGDTPLHRAVIGEHPQIVRQLLAAGADPTMTGRQGRTALEAARQSENAELVRLLESASSPTP